MAELLTPQAGLAELLERFFLADDADRLIAADWCADRQYHELEALCRHVGRPLALIGGVLHTGCTADEGRQLVEDAMRVLFSVGPALQRPLHSVRRYDGLKLLGLGLAGEPDSCSHGLKVVLTSGRFTLALFPQPWIGHELAGLLAYQFGRAVSYPWLPLGGYPPT